MSEKKFWNEKNVITIGMVLTFFGLGLQIIFFDSIAPVGSFFSTVGILLVFKGYLVQKNSDKLKKDERSRKIGAWAASHSWIVTVLALVLIFWVNKLNIIPLGTDAVIGLTYIVMVVSLLGYKYYFDKKGDIE